MDMGPISVSNPLVVIDAAVIDPREFYQPKTLSTAPIQSIDLTQATNDSISIVGLASLVNLNNQTPEKF